MKKLVELENWFDDKQNVMIALSGGVDSALVAYAAEKVLNNKDLGYIARYALGKDYHSVLRDRLHTIAKKINDETDNFKYRAFVMLKGLLILVYNSLINYIYPSFKYLGKNCLLKMLHYLCNSLLR